LYTAASTRPGSDRRDQQPADGTIVLAPDGVAQVIDPHAGNRGPQEITGFSQAADDHDVFVANLAAGVSDRVRDVRSSVTRHESVTGSTAAIDAAHRCGLRARLRLWGARVGAGGTMLIHDSFSAWSDTAIGRELAFGRRFRYVGRSRSLSEYHRDLPAGRRARISNALRQFAQLPWFAKNLALKVLLTLHLGPMIKRVTGRRPEWPY
jgi:hypothetical protein